MAIAYDDDRRAVIRQALHNHMRSSYIGAKRLFAILQEKPDRYKHCPAASTILRFLNPHPKSSLVGHGHVETLESYLIDVGVLRGVPVHEERSVRIDGGGRFSLSGSGSGKITAEIGNKPGDLDFKALCVQFQINDDQVAQIAKEYRGVYEFFALSEETPGYVVYGAISLVQGSKNMKRHRKTNALLVKEVQKGKKGGRHEAFERWEGYFLENQNTCVILHQSRSLHIPKFYVLQPERHQRGTRKVTRMNGRMVKVGTNGGMFSSRVVMFRDVQAYGNCNLVPFEDTPPDIREALLEHDTRSELLLRNVPSQVRRQRRQSTTGTKAHSLIR